MKAIDPNPIHISLLYTQNKWKGLSEQQSLILCRNGRCLKFIVENSFNPFHISLLAKNIISLLSYRVAGGCKAPRAGIDSVCCSQPGESPPPRLLKKISIKNILKQKIYNIFTGDVSRVCCREAAVGVSRVTSVGVPWGRLKMLRVSHQLCGHFAIFCRGQ